MSWNETTVNWVKSKIELSSKWTHCFERNVDYRDPSCNFSFNLGHADLAYVVTVVEATLRDEYRADKKDFIRGGIEHRCFECKAGAKCLVDGYLSDEGILPEDREEIRVKNLEERGSTVGGVE